MISGAIEADDLETLTEILELEKNSYRQKRSLCFAMFMLAFACLAIALTLVVVRLASVASEPVGLAELGGQAMLLPVLAPLAAVSLSFFGMWWAVQNCLNTIERSLCAARNRRAQLFGVFVKEIQCANKEKQRAWLEIIKAVVG
jgi:hypothetical protein